MNAFVRILCVWLTLAAAVTLSCRRDSPAEDSILLATTTSTQDSGLLDVLVPRFQSETGISVKVIAVGTGAALRMASRGDADAVLVHAPEAEKDYVDAGDLVEGRRIMHNDYVIVGPPDDPAGVRQQRSLAGVIRAIAESGVFISRGDNSGTHAQELRLWAAAGVDVNSLSRREETGQGMGATLNVADQKRAYALTDLGTYLALRKRLRLRVLFEGDASLQNIYHAYVVNPEKHRRINVDAARQFTRFLVSPAAQRAIGDYKREEFGKPLFVPDALLSTKKTGLDG